VRVLVVEDDLRMAAAIRRGLRSEGLAADVATGGLQALGMASAGEYDAVVLDVMLPDLDGFETCRRLRADGVWLPVIMLTARDAVEDRVRGLDQGADDYLTKPLEVSDCGGGFGDLSDDVFERFVRGDAARTSGGAGLGLAIVRAVAEAHGGTAAAAPGSGASVCLRLPVSGSSRRPLLPSRQ